MHGISTQDLLWSIEQVLNLQILVLHPGPQKSMQGGKKPTGEQLGGSKRDPAEKKQGNTACMCGKVERKKSRKGRKAK